MTMRLKLNNTTLQTVQRSSKKWLHFLLFFSSPHLSFLPDGAQHPVTEKLLCASTPVHPTPKETRRKQSLKVKATEILCLGNNKKAPIAVITQSPSCRSPHLLACWMLPCRWIFFSSSFRIWAIELKITFTTGAVIRQCIPPGMWPLEWLNTVQNKSSSSECWVVPYPDGIWTDTLCLPKATEKKIAI